MTTTESNSAGQSVDMPCPKAEPQKEHDWLHKLVGDWTCEMECSMGPGQRAMTSTATESVRSLGGLWTIGEGRCDGPDGVPMITIMTLGYDPRKQKFVGTFVASMMTHLWTYEGNLDPSGRILTLHTEGPSATGDGTLARYQDIIEFVNDDHRTLRSKTPGEDGAWHEFMVAHYRRQT